MQASHRVAINTCILYARMFSTIFITLYATRLLLADLGVEDFGIYNLIGGVIAMLGFLNTSMTAVSQRFMSVAKGGGDIEKVKRIFNMSTIIHFFVGLFLVVLFEFAYYILFNGILKISVDRIDAAKAIYQFMVLSTFSSIVMVPYDAIITANENMTFYAILSVIDTSLKLIIAFFISLSPFDHLQTYGFLVTLMSLFLLFIRIIYCQNKYPECKINFKKYHDKPLLNEMMGFASWTFLGTTASMLSIYGQGIVLNIYFGSIINASHALANQVSGQISNLSSTMHKALNPMLGKKEGEGNRILMIDAAIIGSKLSVLLMTITIIPISIEMPLLFKMWLKDTPIFAIAFCRLMLIRILIEQYHNVLVTSIVVVGNIKKFEIINSLFNISPLIISYILLDRFGSVTLYYVYIFFAVSKTIGVIYFSKLNCQLSIQEYLNKVVTPSACCIIVIISVSIIPSLLLSQSFFRLFLTICLSILSSCFSIWFLGLSDFEKSHIITLKKHLFIKFSK